MKGALRLFSNVDENGRWLPRFRTLLIDSSQLESGEALSDDFRRIAGREIEEFKRELRLRGDPRNPDELTDADILREVMNTVGRPDRLGADIRCVVSVSMLTEGWDANTVTHIMGVRAFGTQLLCEQVVGRGLAPRVLRDRSKDRAFPGRICRCSWRAVLLRSTRRSVGTQAAAARDPRQGHGRSRRARNPLSQCRELSRRLSAQTAQSGLHGR